MKSALVGSIAGALVFAALRLVTAQTALTVQDFHRNSKAYVGSQVQITGLAYDIRQRTRRINNQDVPYISLNLFETDSKGRKGRYFVWVSLPTSQMKTMINEGDPTAIVGTMKWPYQVGMIEE